MLDRHPWSAVWCQSIWPRRVRSRKMTSTTDATYSSFHEIEETMRQNLRRYLIQFARYCYTSEYWYGNGGKHQVPDLKQLRLLHVHEYGFNKGLPILLSIRRQNKFVETEPCKRPRGKKKVTKDLALLERKQGRVYVPGPLISKKAAQRIGAKRPRYFVFKFKYIHLILGGRALGDLCRPAPLGKVTCGSYSR